MVAYELLTGVHPFVERTLGKIVNKITHGAHRPVRELRPEAPGALAQIVDRTLKKHPAGRYATAMDLAGDLSLVYDNVRLASQDPRVSKRFHALKDLAFFAEFPAGELREVMSSGQWLDYAAGSHILVEGEPGDSFFVMVNGRASVVCAGMEVGILTPGASFGEIGFLIKQPRTATIVAKIDCTVIKIRASLIEHTSLSCQLRFQRAFLRTMAVRLTSMMGFLADSVG